jgi:transcriptional regulator with XRE-family HTH domain
LCSTYSLDTYNTLAQWPLWVIQLTANQCHMLCCMADYTKPTPKGQHLGAALKAAREAKSLGVRELGREIEMDPTKISNIERGKRLPSESDIVRILTHLGVVGDEQERIVALRTGANLPQWAAITLPEQREHLDAVLDFESKAKTIVTVSPLLIPGLLQVGSYVRAIMTGGSVPDHEIAGRIATRLGRQNTITRRREPAELVAFVGEAALRAKIGGDDVMREQLEHLLDEAKRPNVALQAIPIASDWSPALEGPFNLIVPRDDADPATTVVQLENRRSGLFMHEEDDVAAYRDAVEGTRRVAMSAEDTVALIADLHNGM